MSKSSKIEGSIDKIAKRLKLISKRYRCGSIEVDRIWYYQVPLVGNVPLLGFEVESGPRVSKYYKGDISNLQELGCHGVIVLSEEGFGLSLKKEKAVVKKLIQSKRAPISVFSDSQLQQMLDLLGM